MSQVKISEVLIHGLSVLAALYVRCVSSYYICLLWHRTHFFSLHAFKVFEAVIAWVNHDKDVRQEFMARLMEHVRLPLLPREYLVQVSARTHHGGVAASAGLAACGAPSPRGKGFRLPSSGVSGRGQFRHQATWQLPLSPSLFLDIGFHTS